jgi:phosphatidylserine/phosphatidylglycerophosphate/cardiolipin synthase-like enzyme
VVWTGSMNLTSTSVCEDMNNFLRVDAAAIANVYASEFEEMFNDHRFGQDSPRETTHTTFTIDGQRVEILFAPEDLVADRIIDLLLNSNQRVDMLAYSFTLDSLAETLVSVSQRGVTIRGVMDEGQVYDNIGTEYDRMRQAGLDFRLDGALAAMHNKVIIIDANIVILGSFNFTRSADERNDENVLIIYDPEIAALYEAEFEKIYSSAQP